MTVAQKRHFAKKYANVNQMKHQGSFILCTSINPKRGLIPCSTAVEI